MWYNIRYSVSRSKCIRYTCVYFTYVKSSVICSRYAYTYSMFDARYIWKYIEVIVVTWNHQYYKFSQIMVRSTTYIDKVIRNRALISVTSIYASRENQTRAFMRVWVGSWTWTRTVSVTPDANSRNGTERKWNGTKTSFFWKKTFSFV